MVVVVPEITSGGLWRKEQVTTAIGSDPLTDRWDGGGISPSRPGGPTHTHTPHTHHTHATYTHREESQIQSHATCILPSYPGRENNVNNKNNFHLQY